MVSRCWSKEKEREVGPLFEYINRTQNQEQGIGRIIQTNLIRKIIHIIRKELEKALN